MPLDFHKMHANGDDFVMVDARNHANPITSQLVRGLGDRHRGIGFNQLVVVLNCEDADACVEFWNADGSALDVCGSATRGVADRLMREANHHNPKPTTNPCGSELAREDARPVTPSTTDRNKQ